MSQRVKDSWMGLIVKIAMLKIKKSMAPVLWILLEMKVKGDDFAARNLSKSIVYGSSGKWGETAMVAHPQLTEEEATEIALLI